MSIRHKRNRQRDDTILIGIILLAGAVLRFWDLPGIPYTFDEFSALFRTQFSSFHELIEKGVKIDTHPAGIQVFMYYLVKWFGTSEAVVKTPFILFGLGSVWLIYRIGKDWFSSAAGLVAASFLAFLQYPVMYSQIARPYASGLFFCLLMTWFWTRILFHHRRKYYLNLAGFVIAASLCTYNHHFSLLFAAMAGITGLFLTNRENRISYITGGITVILLYIPHLPIFFTQLGMGGVEGWLRKPRWDFIYDYFQYAFHFSFFLYGLIVILIILQFAWRRTGPSPRHKLYGISLVWFLLPYLAGFFYSRYVNAVLQYSTLLFSFPFLLFLIAGHFRTDKTVHKVLLVILIMLVTIPSLILERRHYRLFYKSPYREMLTESKKALDKYGEARCTVLLDTKKEINDWYLAHFNWKNYAFRPLSSFRKPLDLARYLDTCRSDILAYGCITYAANENYPMILDRFPYLLRHETYAGGDFYLFSRKPEPGIVSEYFSRAVNTFEPGPPEWGWIDQKKCIDSMAIDGKLSYSETSGNEYGPSYQMGLRPMLQSQNDVIDISADFRLPKEFKGALLGGSVSTGKLFLSWTASQIVDYIDPGTTGRVYYSMRMSDIDMRHHNIRFSAFVWNPAKQYYILDNFTVRVRHGNPVIYGLYTKVK